MYAGSTERLEQGFRDITEIARIPGRKDPQSDVFKLVHDWLSSRRSGRWLLVLDNVDEAHVLPETGRRDFGGHGHDWQGKAQQPLSAYLPPNQHGAVLITSRSSSVALRLVEEKDLIAVKPMTQQHALALFQRKLGPMADSKYIGELAAALDYMPLAIVQAAAYIHRRAPRCSVEQYLVKFRESDRHKTSLLDFEGGQLRRDWDARNSIILTWQLSFEHIRRSSPSAADLLSLMSFFDRQSIPDELIRNRAASQSSYVFPQEASKQNIDDESKARDEDDDSICSKDNHFEDDVQVLRNYSFISFASTQAFEMHALVQLATRTWLKAYGELEKWKQLYIVNLSAVFPSGEYENWIQCRALFPHAKLAATQRPKGEESLKKWASLLHNTAWYACEKGSIAEAINLSEKAMKVRQEILGEMHADSLSSIEMVGQAYRSAGRWDEAEKLQQRVVEARKGILGGKHPDTLTSMANLALTYHEQGRQEEAEKLEEKVLGIRKEVLGENHRDTIYNLANQASIYRIHGRWKESEELGVQMVATKTLVLGKDHPDTLYSMASLALTYQDQGRPQEADNLATQVMETSRSVLGEEHPDALSYMSNLAAIYWNQKRWEEAEKLEIRLVETRERVLGRKHPDTLTSLSNLAFTWESQGRRIEARALMGECAHLRSCALGADHPDTLSSFEALTRWQSSTSQE